MASRLVATCGPEASGRKKMYASRRPTVMRIGRPVAVETAVTKERPVKRGRVVFGR